MTLSCGTKLGPYGVSGFRSAVEARRSQLRPANTPTLRRPRGSATPRFLPRTRWPLKSQYYANGAEADHFGIRSAAESLYRGVVCVFIQFAIDSANSGSVLRNSIPTLPRTSFQTTSAAVVTLRCSPGRTKLSVRVSTMGNGRCTDIAAPPTLMS